MKILLLAAALSCGPAAAQAPRLSGDRVVLRTDFGDIVVALYPDAAPQHVARFLDNVRKGGYDGTTVFKIDRARMLHIEGAGRLGTRLLPAQVAALTHLEPETGAAHHTYGTLTFARDPNDPDKTGTSFAIMLAVVPAMDGRFTAFGQVVDGFDTLETIRAIPVIPGGAPIETITVVTAFVRAAPESVAPRRGWFVPGLLIVCGLIMSAWGKRASWVLAASMGLLLVLTGFFLLFAAYAPAAGGSHWVGLALLAGAIAVFYLMTFFESRPRLSK